ncbi:hypothetical protein PseuLF5_13685 [Pseudomonas sp. LF-5]|uniref:hypothetical protein n=1 Tax=Pseudomonas sp. LF-5 TaxID=3031121 RepID=UPI00309B5210
MFKTIRDAELILKRKTHPQAQFWQYVELGNYWPWFYVVLVQKHKQALHQSFVFAPSISSLEALLSNSSQSAWIDKVYVATPGNLNGSEDWKMELLTELLEVRTLEGSLVGHLFNISDGRVYTTASLEMMRTQSHSVVIFSDSQHLGPKI